MGTTPVSLLERLKEAEPDSTEWQRLHDLYLPLIRSWLTHVPGLGHELDDLSQEVLLVVVRELPRFKRARDGSFRTWLRRVTVHRVYAFRRKLRRRRGASLEAIDSMLQELEDPASNLATQWDEEHDQHVFRRLLAAVRDDFSDSSWEAFQQFAIAGIPAAQVAANLGLSENAVLLAKSRILKRLRTEAKDLLD